MNFKISVDIWNLNWFHRREVHGADERSRTADLLITNQLLYQLSYVG